MTLRRPPAARRPAGRALLLAAALGLAAPALAQDAPDAPDANDPVATAGGETVRLGDLIATLRELPPQFRQMPDPMLYDALREQAVTQALLAQAAEAAALADDPEVAQALERQRRSLLAGAFLTQAIDARVDEAAIREAYEARYVEAEPVREIRARHILVEEEAVAEALKARIEAGEDFAALAAEAGTDGTAQRGGDLGFFGPEQMVPGFADAAFAAPLGEVVGPVETQFGWHLIEVTEERTQPAPPFEMVQGQIAQDLAAEAAQELIAELRENAAVALEDGRPGLDGLRDDSLIAYP